MINTEKARFKKATCFRNLQHGDQPDNPQKSDTSEGSEALSPEELNWWREARGTLAAYQWGCLFKHVYIKYYIYISS